MKTTMHYLMMILFFVSLLIGQLGCAHMPQHPSEEVRAQFGTIGIVSVRSALEPEFNPAVAKGRGLGAGKGVAVGLGKGALVGAAVGAKVGAHTEHAAIILFPVLVAGGTAIGGAIGALAGGVAGATNAVPKAEAREIEAMIKGLLARTDIQLEMAEHILRN